VPLNFDFHPAYMLSAMRGAGFRVVKRLPVSYFRLAVFKRFFSTDLLVKFDSALQERAPLYSPSVFTRNTAIGDTPDVVDAPLRFRCPTCGGDLREDGDRLICQAAGCGLRWASRGGITDFKEPVGKGE